MFAGHVGAGLALGALAPRKNPGLLVLAALVLDVVLWGLVLAGIERVLVPVDYERHHFLTFFFPYSHGLVASSLWALVSFVAFGRGRWGRLVAAGVASHFVLDWIVHVPEMPLLGPGSTVLGLGLWNRMPLALALEAFIALAGLSLFLRRTHPSTGRALWLTLTVLLVLGMTVAGQTVLPAPPSAAAAAVGGLGGIAVTVGLVSWIGR